MDVRNHRKKWYHWVGLMSIFFIFSKDPLENQPSIINPQYVGSQTDCHIDEQYSTIDDVLVSKTLYVNI